MIFKHLQIKQKFIKTHKISDKMIIFGDEMHIIGDESFKIKDKQPQKSIIKFLYLFK